MNTLTKIRKIDELGRIVIPRPMCDVLALCESDPVNMILYQNRIIIEKHVKDQSRFEKPIGIIRKMDELNRIVLPKEIRDELGIAAADDLLVTLDTDQISLEPAGK